MTRGYNKVAASNVRPDDVEGELRGLCQECFSAVDPLRRLTANVLHQALRDLLFSLPEGFVDDAKIARIGSKTRDLKDAIFWFTSDDTYNPYSFTNCVERLGLSISRWRAAIATQQGRDELRAKMRRCCEPRKRDQ